MQDKVVRDRKKGSFSNFIELKQVTIYNSTITGCLSGSPLLTSSVFEVESAETFSWSEVASVILHWSYKANISNLHNGSL